MLNYPTENKVTRRPRGRQNTGQKKEAPPHKIDHHPDVARYRDNMTDKCSQEVAAAKERASRSVTIGSREYMEIAPVCDRSCGSKYHWCPTCFLAPRCDCMMPHFSSVGQPPNQTWYLDQVAAVKRFDHLPCDNRYWAMTNAIREIAFGRVSGFCESCTDAIRSASFQIRRAHGRTYLELAHYLWTIVGDNICATCIDMINGLECASSKSKCPSTGVPLINSRLTNYQSRKYGERPVSNPEPSMPMRPYLLHYGNWSDDATRFHTGVDEVRNSAKGDEVRNSASQKNNAPGWRESIRFTNTPSSSPRESFSIISGVVEAALDENAPMLLASQLMDLWFPESEDDAPVGSAVSIF